jgi:hypothetical protein
LSSKGQPEKAEKAVEKKQQRPQQRAQAKASAPLLEVTPELVNRAKREVQKMKYVTPYRLSSVLGVKVSVARKLLRELIRLGAVEARAKNRRLIVAVPKQES